jgi:hypothetical protein
LREEEAWMPFLDAGAEWLAVLRERKLALLSWLEGIQDGDIQD